MNSSQPPPSQYPPSMGPGARPSESQSRSQSTRARVQEMRAIRQSYSVEQVDEGLKLQYDINNQHRSYYIPFSCMTFPSLMAMTPNATGSFMIDLIRGTENVSGITPSQQAAEAFAYHGSKSLVWGWTGMATVLGASTVWWRRGNGMSTMKFPFRAVKDPAKYQKFPNRFIPILNGPLARAAWQGTRWGVLALYSLFLLNPIFRSIGTTSMSVGLYRDERTRPMIEKIRERGSPAANRGNQRPVGSYSQSSADAQAPTDESSGSSNDQSAGNDMADGYSDGMDSTGDAPAAPQLNTRQNSPQQQQQQRTRFGRPPAPPVGQQPPPSRPAGSDDPFEFNSDPLSSSTSNPDSPQYDPNAAAKAKRETRSWASVRREARTGTTAANSSSSSDDTDAFSAGSASSFGSEAASPRQRRNPASSSSNESYSYGGSEAERQHAKDDAQKEFDALLEKERQLGQEGGGAAGGRRGRGAAGGGGPWG